MYLKPLSRFFIYSSLVATALGTSSLACAAFIEDSKATVELRNFYIGSCRDEGKIHSLRS